jgi:hypothetical protein
VLSILDNKIPNYQVKVCWEGDMEEFFKLEREGVCRYYLKNECRKGEHCEFRHEEDHNKMGKFKTKLCLNFVEKGACKYRDQCSYAHGEAELQKDSSTTERRRDQSHY